MEPAGRRKTGTGRLLLKNGRCICPATRLDRTMDLLIEGGKIAVLRPRLDIADARIADLSGLVVAPGFIDMHVHLREPGQEEKETIESGARAAARGGFTAVCCMPNTSPVNDRTDITRFILGRAASAAVHVLPIAAVSLGLRGERLTDMAGLAAAGAAAFSDDGRPVSSGGLMRRALEFSKKLGPLVIDHCEDLSLSDGGVMHEGAQSGRLGLKGIPSAAEEVMAARDIILAGMTGARVHLAHASTAGTVRLLRQARKSGIRVSAEVTPHHLLLTDAACAGRDPNCKVNPPLRGRGDTEALLEAVAEGIIDVFATDHAPHTPLEKKRDFNEAPFGIIGLETAVSLLLDRLVLRGRLPLRQFVRMWSAAPASLLGLGNKGLLKRGADADLTILDLGGRTTVDAGCFVSRGRNSPFDGWKLKGVPAATIVGGRVAFPFDGRLPGERA